MVKTLTKMTKDIVAHKMNGATVYYRDDNIIHIHYNSGHLCLDDAKALIKSVREKSSWLICPIFISAEPFAEHDQEAQKYLSGKEVMSYSSAVAILAKSLAQKIAINFFIKFQKPSKPTKFFTSEREAINWLNKFESIHCSIIVSNIKKIKSKSL